MKPRNILDHCHSFRVCSSLCNLWIIQQLQGHLWILSQTRHVMNPNPNTNNKVVILLNDVQICRCPSIYLHVSFFHLLGVQPCISCATFPMWEHLHQEPLQLMILAARLVEMGSTWPRGLRLSTFSEDATQSQRFRQDQMPRVLLEFEPSSCQQIPERD